MDQNYIIYVLLCIICTIPRFFCIDDNDKKEQCNNDDIGSSRHNKDDANDNTNNDRPFANSLSVMCTPLLLPLCHHIEATSSVNDYQTTGTGT